MKRIITLLAAGLALFLTGCATDMSRYYAVQEKALEADNNVVMALAAAAASGNQGAIVALALRQGNAGKIAVPQDKALQWASILVPSLTQLYGINQNTAVALRNIEADTAQYSATLSTFGTVAGQGIEAAAKSPIIVGTSEQQLIYPNED